MPRSSESVAPSGSAAAVRIGDGVDAGAPRVLMSARAAGRLSGRLAACGALRVVTLERAHDDAPAGVDAAFISRDVTGASTKSQPSPALAALHAVLRRSPALAWVHTHSAGADRPVYAELQRRGVRVTTSSGANAPGVAHTALAAVLALARGFPALMAAQARREWRPLAGGPLPHDLGGQTAVLVGWGPIGRTLQPLLTALGLRVVVVRHSPDAAGDGVETVRTSDLAAVLPRADWLILACPLTPQTRGLVDAAALATLPVGARLVNVARGEVIDEPALVAALLGGRLAGAFLDVFVHEPLPADSPLWTLPGVIVSPHSAGQSEGNAQRVDEIFLAHLGRWLGGRAAPVMRATAAGSPVPVFDGVVPVAAASTAAASTAAASTAAASTAAGDPR